MIIIPARLASTRFKNKILCDIGGLPMFVKTAKNCEKVDKTVVACDDERVLEIAHKFEIKAVLTSTKHQSGTDRINEACGLLSLDDDEIIVNVQADEPFFEEENLRKFLDFATHKIQGGAFMASCYKMISNEQANEANLVKVVLDKYSNAIYFSRSKIPYDRAKFDDYMGHIGVYGYSVKNLREFCNFSPSILEDVEKLEQLRALQEGKKIAMIKLVTQSIGIDCKEDLQKALDKFGV